MTHAFRIYRIEKCEVYWVMFDAVVSGKDPEDACAVLTEYLQSGRTEDVGFCVRGRIEDTGINADARAVIYSGSNK